jgi:hypothetical protein
MATLAQLLVVTYGRGADDGVIHLARQYYDDIAELEWVILGSDESAATGRRIATLLLPSPVDGGIPIANLGAIYSWEFPEVERDALIGELIASGWHKIAETLLPEARGRQSTLGRE